MNNVVDAAGHQWRERRAAKATSNRIKDGQMATVAIGIFGRNCSWNNLRQSTSASGAGVVQPLMQSLMQINGAPVES